MKVSRTDRSLLADWWYTVDKVQLAAVLTLLGVGLILSLAASPAVAERKGFEPLHFFERHALHAFVGSVTLLGLSFVRIVDVRRISLLLFVATTALMIAVPILGEENQGAQRWLVLAGFSIQPSELLKPALVVLLARLFADYGEKRSAAAAAAATGLLGLSIALLALQPDIGQAALLTIIWGILIFAAGLPAIWFAGFGLSSVAALTAAYFAFSHVASRIDRFLDPASGDTYQLDLARQSFINGGWLGKGPGEGTIKATLPDAHTDFIFAVIAEEYGIIACLILLALYGFIVVRALAHIWAERDAFVRYAVIGLVLVFAVQALINMGVNVGVLPATGMTLPFISYGGSSSLGTAIGFGMILALTRRRADPSRLKRTVFYASDQPDRLHE